VDLLEELARHYGYERFPATLPVWSGEGRGLKWQSEERAVRDGLRGLGYSEACTLAFSQVETEKKFAPDDDAVALRNPLSEDEPVLRTSLVPSLLRTLRGNLNRGIRDLRLYEIGKVYPTRGEYRQLVLAMTGSIQPQNVHGNEVEAGFYSLKGDVEAVLGQFDADLKAHQDALPAYYHPGRTTRLGEAAILGELDENIAGEFRIRQKVYIAEVEIEDLYARGRRTVAVMPIPKYPRVRRDFSLILDNRIRFSDVVTAIRSAGVAELVGIVPFDRIEKGPFPESCYGLGVALEYQSPAGTLTDAQVEGFDRRVLSELETIGAKLRG
jgi:phenylalanyl-tRNA synthetase beta chain